MDTQEKKYWVALQTGVPGGLFSVVRQIVLCYGSVEAFWRAKDTARLPETTDSVREKLIQARKTIEPDRLWETCRQKKIGVVCCIEDDYPGELLPFADSPIVLYYYGKSQLLNRPSAAIVGSRRCSAYGRAMAERFARAFSDAGLCLVSGMAKGIDAAAHQGALSARGDTIAVLGCGADVLYPPENRGLYWRIREEGLVLSEYFPGEKPEQWHFPLRNRIISGLSRFVFLVEGQARSGALITCEWAAEQGKDVWALPGPVTNPYSIGPLQLILDGAQMAITPQAILRAYDESYGDQRVGGDRAMEDEGQDSGGGRQMWPVAGRAGAGSRGGKQDMSRSGTGSRGGKQAADDAGQQVLSLTANEALASLSEREKKLFALISYYPVHIDGLLKYYMTFDSLCGKIEGSLYLDLTKLLSFRLIEKLPGDYYQRI